MIPTTPVAQAHADAGPTELAARQRAAKMAGTLRGRALAAVAAAGDQGLTVTEALDALGLPERKRYSLAPRFPELVREGYLTKGDVRDDSVAYVATVAGREWASGPQATTHMPCCSAHGVPMTCKRYRRAHFVEVRPCCSIDAIALRTGGGVAA